MTETRDSHLLIMIDIILTWWAFLVFAIGSAWTLRRAEFRWFQGSVIRRTESPLRYWTWTCAFMSVTVVLLLMALVRTFVG
jgi:hypothetical protein